MTNTPVRELSMAPPVNRLHATPAISPDSLIATGVPEKTAFDSKCMKTHLVISFART